MLKNRYILNAAYPIQIGTWQLPRQMPTYIEKKHYHVGKKVADVNFIWHQDTLFQSSDNSIGTSLLQKISLSTFISETTGMKLMPSSNHVYNFIADVFIQLPRRVQLFFIYVGNFLRKLKFLNQKSWNFSLSNIFQTLFEVRSLQLMTEIHHGEMKRLKAK